MTASLEDIKTIELDEWKGLNTASSPTKLQNGESPSMENVWVDEKPGSVITANGFLKVGTIPSGNPAPFCIDFFKSSTGEHLFVVSDNATVWKTVDFQNFTSLITGLSASFQLRGKIIRDKLWLTNGSDSVRTYDGTTVTVLDGTAGTPTVPKGRFIEYHDERVWLFHTPADRSGGFFSALANSSGTIIDPDNASAWPSDNELQIAEGDGDFGTGLYLYRGFLYFFKQYSIWRLVGYDEFTYSRVKTRSGTGTRFNESLAVLDGLVHQIGTDGIYLFDGENSERISDLIDPATASQSAFGFGDLQQPNTNNQFWQTAETIDWNAGTVARNLDVDDSIVLEAADTSQADFTAGATKTNVDLTNNPDQVQLSVGSTSVSLKNVALDAAVTKTFDGGGTSLVGSLLFFTDGNVSNAVGVSGSGTNGDTFELALSGAISYNLTTIVLKAVTVSGGVSSIIFYHVGGAVLVPTSVSGSATLDGAGHISFPVSSTPTDYTITYPSFSSFTPIGFLMAPNHGSFVTTELKILTAAYSATGKFTSQTLDLGEAPHSLGNFNADVTTPAGTSLTYFTQSSADGAAWDAEVAVTNGGAIASTIRRYLRWGANFVSDGTDTPIISDAWLPSQFISPVHNTGGSIFAWGPVESDYSPAGQTVRFYYRTGTTSPNCLAATWNVIVPGGVISDAVANVFVQFKIEIDSGDDTHVPSVLNFIVNWVVGTGTQPQTLQNVASIVWRNRYWLSAAGSGATENDTILIRGKKTFGSPWMLKDWPILSFTRFYNDLYGCSSVDGSIYKLDTGYSKDSETMDAFFETGDFTFGGFFADIQEFLVEVERMGPYSLSVGYSTDRGVTWTDKSVDLTVGAVDSYTKRLNVNIYGDKVRFRYRINAADRPFQIHRFVAFYKLSKARGSLN